MSNSLLDFQKKNPRKHNTNKNGGAWTQQEINSVWDNGTVVAGYSSNIWRKDKCGSWMKFDEYGNRNSQNGWEIDHINAVANGGGDEPGNLQPLNWANNAAKSDKISWTC